MNHVKTLPVAQIMYRRMTERSVYNESEKTGRHEGIKGEVSVHVIKAYGGMEV